MHILLIEDYAPTRETLEQGLREAGFAVDAAADGRAGLRAAMAGEYDVIILDLMLPLVDGMAILGELRRKGRQTHVLVLTAKDTLEDRVKGLNAGADDYLVKPFAFKELVARVRALVRRQYQAKDPVLRLADLTIDTAARTVARAGRMIGLTAREYALLEFLASRAGTVVTRTEIWEHVYEFNAMAESNVVDVYIGHLRRKLDRPGSPPLIHTRRGHGYILQKDG
ncbi:MAG: response regulator transcription factor [Lentisphaeria bacterium]|jgi:DNA-binding response OmpR family regulator